MIKTTLAPGAPWPEFCTEKQPWKDTDWSILVLQYLKENPNSAEYEIVKGCGFDCNKTIRSMLRRKKIVRHDVPTGRIRVRYSAP